MKPAQHWLFRSHGELQRLTARERDANLVGDSNNATCFDHAETETPGEQRAEPNDVDGSGSIDETLSTNRSCTRLSRRESNAALIVARSGPEGIGTSSCHRIPLPRASTPPLSPRPWTSEARLEQVVRREREESLRK